MLEVWDVLGWGIMIMIMILCIVYIISFLGDYFYLVMIVWVTGY
jgi:hypothetical protein